MVQPILRRKKSPSEKVEKFGVGIYGIFDGIGPVFSFRFNVICNTYGLPLCHRSSGFLDWQAPSATCSILQRQSVRLALACDLCPSSRGPLKRLVPQRTYAGPAPRKRPNLAQKKTPRAPRGQLVRFLQREDYWAEASCRGSLKVQTVPPWLR